MGTLSSPSRRPNAKATTQSKRGMNYRNSTDRRIHSVWIPPSVRYATTALQLYEHGEVSGPESSLA
jgi:hypothetical protein